LIPLPSALEMKEADAKEIRALGGDEFSLMERVSLAISDAMASEMIPSSVLVVCGPGNNGGDGLCVARFLLERGVSAKALRIPSSHYSKSNEKAFQIFPKSHLVQTLIEADLYIDALLGAGQKLPLKEEIKKWIPKGKRVWSIDIPTGVDVDTGEVDKDYAPPEKTFVVQAIKRGMSQCDCGELIVVETGIKIESTQFEVLSIAAAKPQRKERGHKYDSGPVGIVAGTMKGAFNFVVDGVKASGASLIIGLGEFEAPDEVIMSHEIDQFFAKKLKSLVVGPGLGSKKFDLKNIDIPIVIDADGLKQIEGLKFGKKAILTPHRGEAKNLLGRDIKDPFMDTLELAKEFQAYVLLKGPGSIIGTPEGRGFVLSKPNPNLSLGGSGDVLAGYIGGLIALGLSPLEALKRALLDQSKVPTRPTLVSASEIAEHLREL